MTDSRILPQVNWLLCVEEDGQRIHQTAIPEAVAIAIVIKCSGGYEPSIDQRVLHRLCTDVYLCPHWELVDDWA